jgi:hypothetical protein
MTPAGIKPVTFQLIGQCLNKLRHHMPQALNRRNGNTTHNWSAKFSSGTTKMKHLNWLQFEQLDSQSNSDFFYEAFHY